MDEEVPNPHELWEDAFYRFEEYAQKKHFAPNSELDNIVSKIRGIFILVINTHASFPEFGGSKEACDLTLRCLDELEHIRELHTGDKNYFPALLNGMKSVAIEVNTACFVTFNENTKDKSKSKAPIHESDERQLSNDMPAKRQKISKHVKTTRAEMVVPSIETSNKFQVLTEQDSMEEATVSQMTVNNNPAVSNLTMDTNETETTVTERAVMKKEPRPPPITVLNRDNFFKQNKEIKALLKGDLKVVNTSQGLRYYTSSEEDFRALKQHFVTKKQEHFTFQLRKDLPLRVVLKRLPANADPGEVKDELINIGYPVRSVKQMTKFENNQIHKMPLFIVELNNTEEARKIYDLNRLLYTVVSIESYRPRSGIKQCFRCQRFNHTFPGCCLTPRCLLCAKEHNHKDCPIKVQAKDNKNLLNCANCGETGHPASYRGCKSFVAALENFNKPRSAQNSNTNVNRTQTTTGNRFTSRKTTQGLSFSTAVRGTQPPPGYPLAANSAQSRLAATVSQSRTNNSGSSATLEQLIEKITPLINNLNSPLDKFMMLSKIVENCLGHNV